MWSCNLSKSWWFTWHQYLLLPSSQLWRLHTLSKHEQCPRHTLQLSWTLQKHKQSSGCCYGDWIEQWALQCGAIFHFKKNYVCFKGQVWAHNHIDIQFIWLHWMLLKDERLEWILSTDKVSFIFSCEVYGSVYYVISDVIIFQKTKDKWNRRLWNNGM